jgi:hypothetical protein
MRSASQHPLLPRIRSPHPYILQFNPGSRTSVVLPSRSAIRARRAGSRSPLSHLSHRISAYSVRAVQRSESGS